MKNLNDMPEAEVIEALTKEPKTIEERVAQLELKVSILSHSIVKLIFMTDPQGAMETTEKISRKMNAN